MKIEYKNLNKALIIKYIPEMHDKICNIELSDSEHLPHLLFEQAFNQLTVTLLRQYDNKLLLKKIFDFYELLAEYGDEEVKNLLQVTLLEYLWDDREVYSRGLKMMGENTRKINQNISSYLEMPK